MKKQGVETYDQITKMKPADLDIVLDEGGGNKLGEKKWRAIIEEAQPLADISLSKAADHFRKVPEVFDLPATDSTEPKELTKLLIPAIYALSTELISPDGISPKRIFFELNKSPADDQTWIVAVKKNKTASKSNDIATFTKTPDALNFAWLPAAAEDKSAVYLKNCLLKLSTPDGESSLSKLREPITETVRSLRINENQLLDTVTFEIEGAPDFDRLQIRLNDLKNKEKTILVVDPLVTFDSPGLVALKQVETKGRFMILQVSVERSKGGLKLTAGLSLNGKLLKSKEDLLAIQNQLAVQVARAEQRLDVSATDRKKLVSAAERNVDRMEDYMKSIKWLVEGSGGDGEPIGFEISAEFDGEKLVLVESDDNAVDKDKNKKK